MVTNPVIVIGVVKDGVVVPEGNTKLPDGLRVRIVVPIDEIPPELRESLEEWEHASNEAWSMIEEWEKGTKRMTTGDVCWVELPPSEESRAVG